MRINARSPFPYILLGFSVFLLFAFFDSIKVEKAKGEKIDVKEYINKGRPLSPVDLKNDWFESGPKDRPDYSIADILSRTKYPILLRAEQGVPLEPVREFVYHTPILKSKKYYEGFTLRYDDRIEFAVEPRDDPLDVQAALSREFAPNTRGETKIFKPCMVRGFPAVGAEAGIQKWENGDYNKHPSGIEWTEPGYQDIPYLRYTLCGDVPVSQLIKIADSLVLFNPR